MKYKINTTSRKLLADILTPVNIYLKVRDVFAGSILLESSDYHGQENSMSIICCDPIASFQVKDSVAEVRYPNGTVTSERLSCGELIGKLETFRTSFDATEGVGLFGYMNYDAIEFFEEMSVTRGKEITPSVIYKMYRYVITVDHFSNQLTINENNLEGKSEEGIDKIEKLIFNSRFSTYTFQSVADEVSNVSDERFQEMVQEGIDHCNRGNVFQIVLSRRFTSHFKGDEFNVYRALRSINPSPYLFYFDYGSFKLFGSSPEAQLQIKNGLTSIYPIAGTFKRTGNDVEDAELANKLAADEKENAEHVMLVDLARNDMNKNAINVKVEVFKEVQFYSHVIHLVSKVTGELKNNSSAIQMAAGSFPAGTLSGAPKHKAITLINQIENSNRGFYGGIIGYLGLNGDFNHAIMIRTFLSKNNELIYQAGAGVVSKSNPKNELEEVNNKLAALRKAVVLAQTL